MKALACEHCSKSFPQKYLSQRFCSSICANRYNLNCKKSPKLPGQYNAHLAEFFGILLGDGSVTRYFSKVYLNRIADIHYAPFVANLAKRLFPDAFISVRDTGVNRGTIDIQISSVDISSYLIQIGFNPKKRTVPAWITRDERFSKAALRGLFDTEGTVGFKYFKGENGSYFYKQLTFTNTNPNLMKFVGKNLERFGFGQIKQSGKNIYISNKTDIEEYLKVIGSHNPKLTKKLEIQKIEQFTYGGGLRRMVRQQS